MNRKMLIDFKWSLDQATYEKSSWFTAVPTVTFTQHGWVTAIQDLGLGYPRFRFLHCSLKYLSSWTFSRRGKLRHTLGRKDSDICLSGVKYGNNCKTDQRQARQPPLCLFVLSFHSNPLIKGGRKLLMFRGTQTFPNSFVQLKATL